MQTTVNADATPVRSASPEDPAAPPTELFLDSAPTQRQADVVAELDAKVEREARELSGEINAVVAGVQHWREQQAAKLEEMKRELENELQEAHKPQPPPPLPPDENSSAWEERQLRLDQEELLRRRRNRPATSASQHLRLLAADVAASPMPEPPHGQENRQLASAIAAKTEALHQADEEMERAAGRLTEYSQAMDDVLARLQALG
jgi:hypothetical protein